MNICLMSGVCTCLTASHYQQSRVLLNLKTSQPFEDVLVDLGQIIKVKDASKMYTTWGQEVSSCKNIDWFLAWKALITLITGPNEGVHWHALVGIPYNTTTRKRY